MSLIENEHLVSQSIELFKNWLEKHPFIRFNGDENIDHILLYFLRARKFNMTRTFDCFQLLMTFMKVYPEWFDNVCSSDYEYTKEPNSPIVVMRNRDANGRRVFVMKVKKLESMEDFRKFSLLPFLASFETETQLKGIVLIIDLREMDYSSFMKFPVSRLFGSLKITKNGCLKIQQTIWIGMPGFVKPIYEAAKHFMSTKIISRMHFLSKLEDLPKIIDVKALPEDYGGTSVGTLDFDVYRMGVSCVKLLNKFTVDLSKSQDFESVGSFRKLEID